MSCLSTFDLYVYHQVSAKNIESLISGLPSLLDCLGFTRRLAGFMIVVFFLPSTSLRPYNKYRGRTRGLKPGCGLVLRCYQSAA